MYIKEKPTPSKQVQQYFQDSSIMLPPTVSSVQRFSPCIWGCYSVAWYDVSYNPSIFTSKCMWFTICVLNINTPENQMTRFLKCLMLGVTDGSTINNGIWMASTGHGKHNSITLSMCQLPSKNEVVLKWFRIHPFNPKNKPIACNDVNVNRQPYNIIKCNTIQSQKACYMHASQETQCKWTNISPQVNV